MGECLEGPPPSFASRMPPPPRVGEYKNEWGTLLRAAVAMGVAPEAFWRLSWREWRMLCGGGVGEVLARGALDEMMARFPDGAT